MRQALFAAMFQTAVVTAIVAFISAMRETESGDVNVRNVRCPETTPEKIKSASQKYHFFPNCVFFPYPHSSSFVLLLRHLHGYLHAEKSGDKRRKSLARFLRQQPRKSFCNWLAGLFRLNTHNGESAVKLIAID